MIALQTSPNGLVNFHATPQNSEHEDIMKHSKQQIYQLSGDFYFEIHMEVLIYKYWYVVLIQVEYFS